MSLAGKDERKEAWKARQDARAPRRSWVMPLIVAITVTVLVGAVGWYFLNY